MREEEIREMMRKLDRTNENLKEHRIIEAAANSLIASLAQLHAFTKTEEICRARTLLESVIVEHGGDVSYVERKLGIPQNQLVELRDNIEKYYQQNVAYLKDRSGQDHEVKDGSVQTVEGHMIAESAYQARMNEERKLEATTKASELIKLCDELPNMVRYRKAGWLTPEEFVAIVQRMFGDHVHAK